MAGHRHGHSDGHEHGQAHAHAHAHTHAPTHANAQPHAHSHTHAHAHPHPAAQFDRAFAIGIGLNLGFVAVEVFYGWKIHSLALLADAGHNLSDVFGLLLAWAGAWAARLRPTARYTYGFQRAGILAAFINAALLLLAMGALAWEAAQRLQAPAPAQAQALQGITIMVVAGIGMVINGATALLFMRGAAHDLNLRGAYLHMAADALVSAGVVVTGGLALWLGWTWLDPLASLLIAAVIVVGTWGLFKGSVHLLLDGVPEGVDLHAVQALLQTLPGVAQVHQLRVWATGTSASALTAQLVMPLGLQPGQKNDAFMKHASTLLRNQFGIQQVTLQINHAPLTPDHAE